jgi:hypothetical protein
MKGVRVYPYPDALTIDFAGETVKNTVGGGNIPTNVQYCIVGQDAGTTQVINWTTGIGSQPLNLAAQILDGNTKSILDKLADINCDATLSYRILPGYDGYVGASASPDLSFTLPKRPAAPASPMNYSVNYTDEKITAGAATLQFSPAGTSTWTTLAASADLTFPAAGWTESAMSFRLRFPATDAAFASLQRTDVIAARPAAPAVTVNYPTASEIKLTGLNSSVTYKYRKNNTQTWTDLSSAIETPAMPFVAGDSCFIYLAATAIAPASFVTTVVASPLIILPVDFGEFVYGETPPAEAAISIIASGLVTDAAITVTEVILEGANASSYNLTVPGDKLVPINGSNTNWKLAPKASPLLGAQNHNVKLKLTYDYNSHTYTEYADVYLTVNKANWEMSNIAGSFDVSQAQAQQLKLDITDAPEGATLTYWFGAAQVAGNPSDLVPTGGSVSHIFTAANGLQHTSTYTFGIRAEGDANHNESAVQILATGYTAYETPVFENVIDIDCYNEQLTFKPGFTAGDYTVTYDADTVKSPHSLTAILNSFSGDNTPFTLSLVRNAGITPPYPKSAAAVSSSIIGRAAAPSGIVSTPVSAPAASDGKLNVAGYFESRIHTAANDILSGWVPTMNQANNLSAGRYDVHFPATLTAFASKIANADVPSHVNAEWTGEATGDENNWNNSGNWSMSDPDGATLPAGLTPGAITNVRIPGDASYFPILTAPVTCDNLYLLPGAQLGGQQHLTYNRAHVQFDLGLLSSSQNKNTGAMSNLSPSDPGYTDDHLAYSAGHSSGAMARSRWYMLSPALKGVVSGDFFLGDYPRTFMRKFNNATPSPDGREAGQWTKTFAQLNEPLNPLEGFALWINTYDNSKYGYREYGNATSHTDASILGDDYGLRKQNGIVELPFFDNVELSAARRIHEYVDGESKFYYIWSIDPHTGNIVTYRYDTYMRPVTAYRLAGDDSNLSYTNTSATDCEILVGNPFVASIDFTEFCTDNASALVNTSYRLWNGDQFVTVKLEGGSYTVLDRDDYNMHLADAADYRYIAPMQSFLVQVKAGASLAFDVTKTAVHTSAKLRGSAIETNTLRITARTADYSSETLIARRQQAVDTYRPEEDVYKLFSQKASIPEVYTVADRYALAMNFVGGDREILIPVGLKTKFKGNISFTLTGMNRYRAGSIKFIDREGITEDITGVDSFDYAFNNRDTIREDRFFILFRPEVATDAGADKAGRDTVYAFPSSDGIRVIASPSNLIRQIAVYSLQGRERYRQTDVDSDRYTIRDVPDEKILLLRVITEQGITNIKLVK